MSSNTVSILEGSTFVVSDRRGDIDASPSDATGLFHRDTRHLSRWKLTLDDKPLQELSTDDLQYFMLQCFLVPGTGTVYTDATLSVVRKRLVGDGFFEEIRVLNHKPEPIDVRLRLEAAADFADLFEVKDAITKKGEPYQRVEQERLVLGYRRERFVRETWISATTPGAQMDREGFTFSIHLEPHGEWATGIHVVPARDGTPTIRTRAKYDSADARARPNLDMSLEQWLNDAPHLSTDWRPLEQIYRRSLIDLAALRYYPQILPGKSIPAAGLPWFMTVFGRDSLITSLQAIPFVSELADTTLRMLALLQARRVDPFRDAEPGKIAHELRGGEMTAFEERPHSPYYGTADATPLFLILLDEYERWTGDSRLVAEFEREARAALGWIDKYGDRDGDGYVEYERRNTETGLENQCWKDSWNSILFADGSMSKLPRACCEIQGYVYDAKLRCARLARDVWGDDQLAERLEHQAAELKQRFNRDFWLADRGYFALALDGDKRPVDSLTSNIGHLLWSGIVDDDKVELVVQHLMGPRLFSGWGVRTMAEGDGGYNPIGYHNGTVWPHDNSIIALGLARHGYRKEAAQIAFALLEAATYFDFRLPEAFAGYAREDTRFPVEYPTACSPQAWATGAPLAFIRAIVGLEPDGRTVRTDPVLPDAIQKLKLTGVRPRRRKSSAPAVARPFRAPEVEVQGIGGIEEAPSAPPISSARELFEELQHRVGGAELILPAGAWRFDVEGVGSWRVTLDHGAVSVDADGGASDLTLKLPESLLLQIARGEKSLLTAAMRGDVTVEGDVAYVPTLQRVLRAARARAVAHA